MNKDRGQQIMLDLRKSGISYVLHEYMFAGVKLIDWIYSIVVTIIFVKTLPVGRYMPFMVTMLTAYGITTIRRKEEKKLKPEPVAIDNNDDRFNGGFLK